MPWNENHFPRSMLHLIPIQSCALAISWSHHADQQARNIMGLGGGIPHSLASVGDERNGVRHG
jgi:hypothetical protein